MQKDIPLIEEELSHVIPHMEEVQKQINELINYAKQQEVSRLNIQLVEKLQKLTNIYQKLNDQLRQIHRQLTEYVSHHLDNQ